MSAPLRILVMLIRAGRANGLLLLFIAFVFVTVSATVGYTRVPDINDPTQTLSWHAGLYNAIGLFTMSQPQQYPPTLLLRIDAFLAPVISASAVFGAFAKILEERMPLLFLPLRGHTVVGGLGRIGMTVVSHEHGRKRPFVAIEVNERAPRVADAESLESGAILLGDMTSPAVLEKAKSHRARRVFLTAHSDVANLDAAFIVRRLAQAANVKPPPKIYAHVFDAKLSDSLEAHLRGAKHDEAEIVPFSCYRFAAKALSAMLLRDRLVTSLRVAPGFALVRTAWPEGEHPVQDTTDDRPATLEEDRRRLLAAFRLEHEEATPATERFAIIGLGRLGWALARDLLRHAPSAEKFLIVERSEETCRTKVGAFSPAHQARIETLVADATEHASIERVEAFRPNVAVICTDCDVDNLRLALDLHARDVRCVTRMFDLEAGHDFVHALRQRGIVTASLSRLFHAAIPILTHERRLLACVNLDVARSAAPEHLFYLAETTAKERHAMGPACVTLDELPRGEACPAPPSNLALVWHRAVEQLDPHPAESIRDPRAPR